MSGVNLGDGVFDVTSFAMTGLTRRAELRANNIANAETPNFRAKTVDFETILSQRLRSGEVADLDSGPAGIETLRDNYVDVNGNSVDLEVETTEMIQDNLMFQAVINGFNYKADVLRSAIGGR